MRELNITTREEGQRLDKILSKYLNKEFCIQDASKEKYQVKRQKSNGK